jgi:predicted nucleic acid-binding protein
MPLVYADTSVLFALFHPRDQFSRLVTGAIQDRAIDFVYWSFLRFELRHALRQARTDVHGEAAWNGLRAGERTQARLRWQSDLHAESIIESADELSAQSASDFSAAGADFLHLAAARRLHLLSALDAFWTCDSEQSKAAKSIRLKARLFSL